MMSKLNFYQKFGVSEYLIIDPDSHEFQAYERRENDVLTLVSDNKDTWKSPLLGMIISIQSGELKAKFPNGEEFKTAEELNELNLKLQSDKSALQSQNEDLKKDMEVLKKRLRELGEDI